jgi:MoaA/NifB/PqqE/SkfB family radical SAM enzyme
MQIENYQRKQPINKNFRLFRNEHAIRFHWDIITHCNFKCPYCYARAEEGNWFKKSSLDDIEKVIKNLEKINKPLEIILLGGEPTLHPKYFDIIEKVSKIKNDLEFGIISNGMFKNPEDFIKKHTKYKKNFSFSITFHPSQHDSESIEKFKNNILIIKDNNFLLNVNVILDKLENKEKIKDILDFLESNNIGFYYNIPFYQVDNIAKPFDESKEYKDFLRKINDTYNGQRELRYETYNVFEERKIYNDIEVYLNDLQDFYGWKCLNNNFEIKAGSTDFIRMCELNKYTTDEINNLQPMICKINKCLCQGLLSNEKIRITSS